MRTILNILLLCDGSINSMQQVDVKSVEGTAISYGRRTLFVSRFDLFMFRIGRCVDQQRVGGLRDGPLCD